MKKGDSLLHQSKIRPSITDRLSRAEHSQISSARQRTSPQHVSHLETPTRRLTRPIGTRLEPSGILERDSVKIPSATERQTIPVDLYKRPSAQDDTSSTIQKPEKRAAADQLLKGGGNVKNMQLALR